jgi:uncharacterized protein (DUF111 family)
VDDPLLVRIHEHVQDLVQIVAELRHRQLAYAAHTGAQRLAFEQLHHEEGRAGLVGAVLQHLHRAGVRDAVRDVRFAQEALAHVVTQAHLRMEDLDGRDVAGAVVRCIHGGHASGAEQTLELPASADRLSDEACRQCFVRIHSRLSSPQCARAERRAERPE